MSTNRARHPLAAPAILSIANSGTAELTLRVKSAPNARTYEVQARTDSEPSFATKGLYSNTRAMRITGLTPGALYTFQVRAIGGSTGYSDWSDPVSHRSL